MCDFSEGSPPKKLTLPLIPAISIASTCASPEGQATITASAPSPPVISFTFSTGFSLDASIRKSREKDFAISRREGDISTIITVFAPLLLASSECIKPIGPAPITTTLLPNPIFRYSCPLIQQENGSIREASSKESVSEKGMRLPCSTASLGIFMN